MRIISDVGRALIPPPEGASTARIRGWRWTVAILLGGTLMLNVTHILYACGFLAAYGYPGFAQAGTIQDLQNEQDSIKTLVRVVQSDQKAIREGQLDSQIQSIRLNQCRAKTDDARAFASQQLQEKLNSYYQLTNHTYFHLPDCNEL